MRFQNICAVFLCLAGLVVAADIPRPSPDFVINLNDGSQLHLSQYRGKVVVLAFILTYCPHCQFTAQTLSGLQKEYGPQGIQVVASAIDPMASMKVPDFIKQFQPGYPVGSNEHDAAVTYLQHPVMFRMMMPQLVFIDRKGTIRAQYAGDDEKFFDKATQEKNIREVIEPLLKENVTQAAHKKSASR
ncbi:MAG: TlpA family protein disulfide reductase [Acidobacteriia bacterium]|nr:TlpA family protein disulfide reductase [Terriglobia bacterium]